MQLTGCQNKTLPEKVSRELKLGEFAQGEEEKKDEKPEGSEPSEEK